jgi:hypothetical protein
MDERRPQPVHDRDDTSPAPSDLEALRSFLSLHDHLPGDTESLPPSTDSLRWWLSANGFLDRDDAVRDRDLRWALEVREALVAKVRESMGEPRDGRSTDALNRAAARAGLRPCFGCEERRPIHVDAEGVEGAVGRLLGAAFLAELDGRWERFRVCGDPTCSAVFYDRSRNRSGKWCSMSTCGNRNKVRAFRERHATA